MGLKRRGDHRLVLQRYEYYVYVCVYIYIYTTNVRVEEYYVVMIDGDRIGRGK